MRYLPLDKLQKLGKIYRLSIDVKVGTSDAVADVTDVTDVALDRHLSEQSNDNKMDDSGQESQNIHNKTKDIENITSDQNDEPANPSQQAPQASPNQKQKIKYFYCILQRNKNNRKIC
jgi:hypothetical protein